MYVVENEMRNVKGGVPDTKAIFFLATGNDYPLFLSATMNIKYRS